LLLLGFVAFAQQTGAFTDPRDNKTYKTTKIGAQVWMARNLNYNAKDSKCYRNYPANCDKYGKLYDWNTAMKACPKGWHLPSREEWQILVDFVGGDSIAGKKLKATSGWNYGKGESGNGIDTFGFSASPGGYNFDLGSFDIDIAGQYGYWWSANEDSSGNGAYYTEMRLSLNDVNYPLDPKSELRSVRCIRD